MKCRNDDVNKRADQYGQLEKAEFERKFKNFKDAYEAPDGLRRAVNKLVLSGGKDPKAGAATALAAISTMARTFDIVLGLNDDKKDALDVTLGARMEELSAKPAKSPDGRLLQVRMTEEEKRMLAPLAGKKIKDLTKEDYLTIFNILYKRQLQETRRVIIDRIKHNRRTSTRLAAHLLIEQKMWGPYIGELRDVNESLGAIGSGVEALKLPDKHSGLPTDELEAIAEREKEEEDEAAKSAKTTGITKTSSVHSR